MKCTVFPKFNLHLVHCRRLSASRWDSGDGSGEAKGMLNPETVRLYLCFCVVLFVYSYQAIKLNKFTFFVFTGYIIFVILISGML